MAARHIAVLSLWAALALGAACSEGAYNGECGAANGCEAGAGAGASAGAGAGQGGASCANPDEARCCPDGGDECAADLWACRPKKQCKYVKCASDEECPGPADSRCGVAVCHEGVCMIDAWTAEPIANQYPGDCKVRACTAFGTLEVVKDPSDIPDDGNPCTFDTCEGDKPVNMAYEAGTPCPGNLGGICVNGEHIDCRRSLGLVQCPPGLYCNYDLCAVAHCENDKWDGQETSWGCGGPDCSPCGVGQFCKVGSDCISGVCAGGDCQAPTHSDGVRNGDETGLDCGYPGDPPKPCNDGEGCLSAADCKSSVCYLGVCQVPTCTDATQNGAETGEDCGGKDCVPCPD